MVEGSARRVLGKADGGCGIGLGVAIDEESRVFSGSKARRQVYSRSGFSYSTLLICDRDDSRQESLASENLAKESAGCKMFRVGRDPRQGSEIGKRFLAAHKVFHVEHSDAKTRGSWVAYSSM